MYSPGLFKTLRLGLPTSESKRYDTLQTRYLDLAIGNELPRSPSSWCLVVQIVIGGTWILPKSHPRTDVASWNTSIFPSTTASTLEDRPSDFFGLGKPTVTIEETISSHGTQLVQMGFGGLGIE